MSKSNVPSDLKYTKSHEWTKEEKNNIVKVGITDHAQRALGDLVFVELPEVNSKIEQSKEFAVVESVKAAADVYAPVSGTVVEVNQALTENPELINQDPYDRGWLATIKIDDAAQLKDLLTTESYTKQLSED